MYEVPDASRSRAGSVAQVVQPGYMIGGERVLRPAMNFAIAKGGQGRSRGTCRQR